MRELASGMRQLAGTKTMYRRAHAAPLAGLISGRAEYKQPNVHCVRYNCGIFIFFAPNNSASFDVDSWRSVRSKAEFMRISGIALLVLSLCGCSGSSDEKPVYEVSGTITFGGGPVAKATVIFSPLDNQPVATGITDNKGVFQLTTYDSFDGAAEGKYDVLISKVAVPKGSGAPVHDPTGKDTASSAPVHNAADAETEDGGATLDPKYGKPGNGMTAEVKSSGDNVFDFKLE